MKTVVVVVLMLLTISSSAGLVYSRHLSRKLFVEIQQLDKKIDDLNVEWSRLQLEQSAWASHGRIEQVARERLGMHMPNADEVIYIKR